MDSSNPPAMPDASSASIPIAQISPTLEWLREHSIRAVVILVWPYSSATKSFCLSLADPDPRLRRPNGQVKAVFHGEIAEEVATTHVGIGDEVHLSLAGTRLVDNETAGNYVAWDLHFDDQVSLEISHASEQLSTVTVEPPAEAVPPTEETVPPPTTPPTASIRRDKDVQIKEPGTWQSPAFMQRSRTSYGSLIDSAFDPFAEEDGYVPGKGRKRPRFSMRSNEWRVVDESESPQEESCPVDWMDIVEREASEQEAQSEAAEDMGRTEAPAADHPVTEEISSLTGYHGLPAPSLQLPSRFDQTAPEPNVDQFARPDFLRTEPDTGQIAHGETPQYTFDAFIHPPTETPRLHPVPSPGLPVPSPLVPSTGQTEYFSSFTSSTQQPFSGRSFTTETHTAAVVQGPTEEQRRSLRTQETGVPQTVPGPTVVDEYAGHLLPNTAHSNEASLLPRNRDSELSPEVVGDESDEEEDLDEVEDMEVEPEESGQEDVQFEQASIEQEVESSGEEESEDEVDDRELQGISQQRYETGQPDVIEIDSGESDEDEIQNSKDSHHNVATERFDTHNPVEDAIQEDRVPDSEGDEEESEEEVEDQAREGEFEHAYDEEGSYESDGHPGEYEYDDESDLESEDVGNEGQQQPPPATQAQPEVVVLDSDSDEGPEPTTQARPTELVKQESPDPREPEQPEPSEDEYLSSYEDSVDYEDEEALPSFNEEHAPDEPSVEESEPIPHAETPEWLRQRTREPQEPEQSESSADEYSSSDEDSVDYDAEEDQPRLSAEHVPDEQSEHRQTDDERVDEAWDELVEVPVEAATDPGELRETNTGLDEADFIAHEHNTDVGHPAEAPFIAPEAVRHSTLGPSPSQLQEDAEETLQQVAAESYSADADTKHEQHDTSRSSAQVSEYVWVNGAASPRARPPSAEAPLSMIDNQQLATPDYSQEVEAPTTHATEEAPLPSEQPVTSVEHLPDIGSLVTQEERVITETPAPNRLASEELIDKDTTPRAVNGREMSSEACERYLRSHAPNRNANGLRSKLAYFAPLATLINLFNSLTDTISIVCEIPSIVQAKTGKKDHILNVHITDKSMGGNMLPAQIIRPHKPALPTLPPGSAVLLRNFRVKTVDHAIVLVSENTSSWAVFHPDSTEPPEVTGPPVEYGAQECAYADDLRHWYRVIGAAVVAENSLHNQLQASVHRASLEGTPASDAGLSDEDGSLGSGLADGYEDSMSGSRSARSKRKAHRRITIHELRDGRRYAEAGSPSSRESIHELRDGTVYANL